MTEEEEDSEAIKTELREAFRLYDKEGVNNENTHLLAKYELRGPVTTILSYRNR